MVESEFSTLVDASDPVIWGIIGAAAIARSAIAPAFMLTPNATMAAIASREVARAEAFARDFNIPTAYATYDELINDPDIEAVYIALPNHLHEEWAIRAMNAGKHVLCEKPLAATAAAAERIVQAADDTDMLCMEAVMYRFHPRIREVEEMLRSEAIGIPQLVRGSFCFTMSNFDNYRNDPAMGGGALLDVGSYCINAARWLLNEEPHTAMAQITLAASGIDETVSGILTFPSGASAHVQCSFASAEHQSLDIIGSIGSIELYTPFTAFHNDETSIRLKQGNDFDEILFPPADPYAVMVAHFSDCVRDLAEPLLPLTDGVGTLRVIDALRRSATTGRAERIQF